MRVHMQNPRQWYGLVQNRLHPAVLCRWIIQVTSLISLNNARMHSIQTCCRWQTFSRTKERPDRVKTRVARAEHAQAGIGVTVCSGNALMIRQHPRNQAWMPVVLLCTQQCLDGEVVQDGLCVRFWFFVLCRSYEIIWKVGTCRISLFSHLSVLR